MNLDRETRNKRALEASRERLRMYLEASQITLPEGLLRFIVAELDILFQAGELSAITESLERLEQRGGEDNVPDGS